MIGDVAGFVGVERSYSPVVFSKSTGHRLDQHVVVKIGAGRQAQTSDTHPSLYSSREWRGVPTSIPGTPCELIRSRRVDAQFREIAMFRIGSALHVLFPGSFGHLK